MSLRKDRVIARVAGTEIRSSHALVAAGTCLLGLLAYGAGCSVPNRTYVDDTASGGTSASGGTTGHGGSAAHGGKGGASTGGTATAGSDTGGMDTAGADTGGASGGTAASGGAPGMTRPVPTKGLIVVGGIGGKKADEAQGVISVVEPITGKELSHEVLPAGAQVAELAYDGAATKSGGGGGDVWYVFIGSAFPQAPDKTVTLQVRYFDDMANSWVTLSTLSTLPSPVPGTVTVLNDRLAYLSHTVVNQKVTPTLTVLDTSDVGKVKAMAYTQDTSIGGLVTLSGTRGTPADRTGVGGTLDLGISQRCTGTTANVCEFHVQPIEVGDAIAPGVAHLIGNYLAAQGATSFSPFAAASKATSTLQPSLSAYFLLSDATGKVSLYITDPDAPDPTAAGANVVNAPQAVNDLLGLTIADCQGLGIFTAQSEQALYGVTLSVGAGKTLDLGREGQLVAYEPFSKDVIAAYNPPTDGYQTTPADSGVHGPELTAISPTSTGGGNIALPLRTKLWAPPTDIRANVIATRYPVPFTCK